MLRASLDESIHQLEQELRAHRDTPLAAPGDMPLAAPGDTPLSVHWRGDAGTAVVPQLFVPEITIPVREGGERGGGERDRGGRAKEGGWVVGKELVRVRGGESQER